MPGGLPGGMLAAGNDSHINSLVVRGLTQGQQHCSRRVKCQLVCPSETDLRFSVSFIVLS